MGKREKKKKLTQGKIAMRAKRKPFWLIEQWLFKLSRALSLISVKQDNSNNKNLHYHSHGMKGG